MHVISLPPAPMPEMIIPWQGWSLVVVTVVVGVSFLIWGLRLHRLPALVAGVAGGFILAPLMQQLIGWNPLAVQIVTVAVVAALAVLVTRVSWALFATAVAGGIAWIVLAINLGEYTVNPAEGDLLSWFAYVWTGLFDRQLVESTWATHQSMLIITVGPAALVALFAGLIFPRLIIAILASFMGAVMTVAACILGLWLIRPEMWPDSINAWLVIAAAVVVATVAGTIFQFARAARASAAAAAES
ncbi:MAG: hypothetical protein ABFD92_12245 [Planctomycetaceae bacterium]|nr:hypothetical protein [Planctomycetaceae bacterium]